MGTAYLTELNSLISGEDQVNNWLQVANGASAYQYVRGAVLGDTTTYGAINGSNGVLIGTAGAAGDYLAQLTAIVATSAQSRIALQDVASVSYTSSGTGTAFTSATAINFGVTAAQTTAQLAAMVGQFLICTATVSGVSVLVARKITAAVAGPGTTPNFNVTLTVDTLTVNGVAATAIDTTAGRAFISPLIEILPASAPVGPITIPLNIKSKYAGFRVFADSGVSVIATGRFA